MCWDRENRWGPGAASPLGMKIGLSVSTFLNLGIGRTSAGKKVGKIVRARFISGNAHISPSRMPSLWRKLSSEFRATLKDSRDDRKRIR